MKKLTIEEAAKLSGMSPQFIRCGLQNETLKFGYAQKMNGDKKFTYFIIPVKFLTEIGRLDLLKEYEEGKK